MATWISDVFRRLGYPPSDSPPSSTEGRPHPFFRDLGIDAAAGSARADAEDATERDAVLHPAGQAESTEIAAEPLQELLRQCTQMLIDECQRRFTPASQDEEARDTRPPAQPAA